LSENAPRNLVDSDIWTINAETGDVRNLTDDDYVGALTLSRDQPGIPDSIPVDGGPIFTLDGAEIIFSRTDWSEGGFDTDLYRIDVEGGEPQHIAFFSTEPFVAWHGAIWQDDTTLLLSYGSVSAREPNNGFWSVNIDSGDARQIWHGSEDQYNATPVMFLPDGRLIVHDQAVYSLFMVSCPYIVLDLASGEQQPIREGNDYCASVVGISPGGATAIASAGPDYGFWFVDLTTFATSEVNADSFATAIPTDRRATRIAGAESQPIVWTEDNVLLPIINLTIPVRVQLEFAA